MPSAFRTSEREERDLIATCLALEPRRRHELGEMLIDLPIRQLAPPTDEQLAAIHERFLRFASSEREHTPWYVEHRTVLGLDYGDPEGDEESPD